MPIRSTIKEYTRRLLGLRDTPERLALAFSVGVFLGFTPFLGLHTILALSLAFLFGLNRVALLIGAFINNPWTLVPIYTLAAWLGGALLGFPGASSLPEVGWSQLSSGEYWAQLAAQWRVLMPFFWGSMLLAAISGAVAYPSALVLIRRARARVRMVEN